MMHPQFKRAIPLVVFLTVWLAWFAWYRLTTNVVVYEERYPSGALKARGLVKHQSGAAYKRHGLWQEFDTNGRVSAERIYVDGVEQPPASTPTRPTSVPATLP